ncbi:MAG: sensor histidine kinase [Nevskiales bacterium]
MSKPQQLNYSENPASGGAFLPDFCGGGAIISVLVITELVAILVTLAAVDAGPSLWERFLLLSLYLQWIGMMSAAGLCFVRRWLGHWSGVMVAGLCYLLLIVITAVVSELAWLLLQYQNLFSLLPLTHLEFLVRSLGVCAVVAALALRYFWLQHQRQQETLALGNARFAALQSRIRPHFLFNTLNSIAELTNQRPSEAERAVEDLATIFRASLDEHDKPQSLATELSLTKAYLRIEAQRLGERLQVEWDIPGDLLEQSLPPLSLQPLVENAVRHGIEPLPEGGCIRIVAMGINPQCFSIAVSNPLGDPARQSSPGAGEALKNIRQRLKFLYGDKQAALEINKQGSHFEARMILPLKAEQQAKE